MRKELIASLSMLGSLAASGAAAAQTCATPPSCETLGFTKSETDCEGLEALKCPFDQSKLYCPQGGGNMSAAAPGAILYSDGTISDSVIASKTPIGVVAYVNGSTGFAISLRETSRVWGGYRYNVPCLADMDSNAATTDMNGKTNTLCLLKSMNVYPAANYCDTYSAVSSGKDPNDWYLPSAGELMAISNNYSQINSTLSKLSQTQISSSYYWSSSESNDAQSNQAWAVSLLKGIISSSDRDNNQPVRCQPPF